MAAVVQAALTFRGVPYRNGGVDPAGFDCSGFTQYVFSRFNLALPREVREQFKIGTSVRSDRITQGDLVFFSTTEPGPSHVGIALDGGQFVHAPSSTGVVRVEPLTGRYWSRRFVGARRVPITDAAARGELAPRILTDRSE
jgi:peptidoglycan DL-endopeptidase CwlO